MRDGPLKMSFSNLNISKTGGAIFAKFSRFAGLSSPYLHFRSEVGGSSNFEGSGAQSCQKWHVRSLVVTLSESQLNCTTDISNIFGVLLAGTFGNIMNTFKKLNDGA